MEWNADLTEKDKDPEGNSLRPHIVWFGEAVPMLGVAVEIMDKADIVVIIGTSLQVYPAASLYQYAPQNVPVYYIDPNPSDVPSHVKVIKKGAGEGVEELIETLKSV